MTTSAYVSVMLNTSHLGTALWTLCSALASCIMPWIGEQDLPKLHGFSRSAGCISSRNCILLFIRTLLRGAFFDIPKRIGLLAANSRRP